MSKVLWPEEVIAAWDKLVASFLRQAEEEASAEDEKSARFINPFDPIEDNSN